MFCNPTRVESLRTRAASQLELIDELESKIKEGNLPMLQVARNQLGDIERFIIPHLEKDSTITASDEGMWLNFAETVLQMWTPEVQKLKAQFDKHGALPIKIIG